MTGVVDRGGQLENGSDDELRVVVHRHGPDVAELQNSAPGTSKGNRAPYGFRGISASSSDEAIRTGQSMLPNRLDHGLNRPRSDDVRDQPPGFSSRNGPRDSGIGD